MLVFLLGVLVVPQWARNKKLIQRRTPEIAEAGLMERAVILSGDMDGTGIFNQVPIQEPAPTKRPFTLLVISVHCSAGKFSGRWITGSPGGVNDLPGATVRVLTMTVPLSS